MVISTWCALKTLATRTSPILNFLKRTALTLNKDLCLGAWTVYIHNRIQNVNPNGYVLLFITKHPGKEGGGEIKKQLDDHKLTFPTTAFLGDQATSLQLVNLDIRNKSLKGQNTASCKRPPKPQTSQCHQHEADSLSNCFSYQNIIVWICFLLPNTLDTLPKMSHSALEGGCSR